MSERIENGWYSRVEGYDGVGKTTLLDLAKEYDRANNLGTVFVREPGGTELGAELREILLHAKRHHLSAHAELAILTGDRRHLWDSVIERALQENRPVVSDRGYESMWCYQGAAGGLDPALILGVTSLLMPKRYVKPDALIFLDLSDEERLRRFDQRVQETGQAADKMESRGGGYQQRVCEAYKKAPRQFGGTVISADPAPEEVFEQALPHMFGPFAKR